jgi:hypothetical protein
MLAAALHALGRTDEAKPLLERLAAIGFHDPQFDHFLAPVAASARAARPATGTVPTPKPTRSMPR